MTYAATMSHLRFGVRRVLSCQAAAILIGAVVPVAVRAAEAVDMFAVAELTDQQAAQLPGDCWDLHLPALTRITPSVARILATKGEGCLSLPGIATLTPEVAEALAIKQVGSVMLLGLTTLEAVVATELANCRVPLYFGGFRDLSPEAAAALAPCMVPLGLTGLRDLSPETAAALGRITGGLILSARAITGPEVAALVAGTDGGLELCDVDELTAEIAAGLAKGHSELSLAGVRTLSPAAAAALATHRASITLGIEAFDMPEAVGVATALAARKGRLRLPLLKRISPRTLTALIAKEDLEMPPLESLELINEPDGSPTDDFVIPERLHRRRP